MEEEEEEKLSIGKIVSPSRNMKTEGRGQK